MLRRRHRRACRCGRIFPADGRGRRGYACDPHGPSYRADPLILSNGRTAIEGLSGKARASDGADGGRRVWEQRPSTGRRRAPQ